jgi:hypothetical protein
MRLEKTCMKRFGMIVGVALSAITLAACNSGSLPASPSAMTGASGASVFGGGGTSRVRPLAVFRTLTDSERAVATNLATAYQGIVQLSLRAHQAGDQPEVKRFAFQLEQEFSYALRTLRVVGGGQLPSPFTASEADQAAINNLATLRSSALDPVYLVTVYSMLQAHLASIQSMGTSSVAAVDEEALSRVNRFLVMIRDVSSTSGIRLP